MVESPVHRRPYQVTKASIDHDKGLAWSLGIGLRAFHIRHTGDHIGRGGDKVASRLNFYPDGAPRVLAEARLRFAQKMPKGGQIGRGGSRAIRVGNAAAEVDGVHLRVGV